MIRLSYKGLTGRVVVPGDCEYNQARKEYNLAIDEYPFAIVYCFEPCDVANAITWSREREIILRVRSGGHNYEGYSTGTGKLVIDTSCMNDIEVNTNNNTVKVQAGTRLLSLYECLYKYGYAFPGGTCPSVAISGLVLGGGIGLSARFLGLTADSLIEAEMIDYAGNQLIASDAYNSELFWALRGAGGGNFGVVTNYKFRLKKVGEITLIQLRWDNNIVARDEFLQVWQEWLPNLDRRMSSFSGIYKRGAWVNAFFYGQVEEARQILEPLLSIPGITVEVIKYVPFIDAVKTIGAIYSKGEAFQAAGRFVQQQFTQSQLDKLIEIMDKAPSDSNSSIRVYSLGGAVRDTEVNATSFADRQANYIMAITSSWEMEDEASSHRAWIKAGYEYIYTITCGSYINFPYGQTPNYEWAYYGDHLRKLQRIKKEYDPCNIFHFPQSIKLT